MAEKKEFWTESRLKKGIIWLVVGIVIVAAATAGWWYYLNMPEGDIPPVLQRQITEAQKAAKKNPKDVNAHLALAQLYIQVKKYDESIAESKLMLKIQKDNEYALSLLGMANELKGNTAVAITYYKQTIDLAVKRKMNNINPALVEARFRLGKIYLDQKKYDAALVQFQTLAEQNSMDADARYYLGLTAYRRGFYDKAVEWEMEATRFVPDYYEAFFVMGQAYEKLGDKAKAIAAYKSVLKTKPGHEGAKEALARLEQ